MQTNFADAILNITITGPLVRIDFGTVIPDPNDPEGKKLHTQVTQQLVMPIPGFMRSFGMQENLVQEMLAKGLIKKNPPAGTN